jgi:hypothetical protein
VFDDLEIEREERPTDPIDISNKRGLQDDVHNLLYQFIVRGIIILFFGF